MDEAATLTEFFRNTFDPRSHVKHTLLRKSFRRVGAVEGSHGGGCMDGPNVCLVKRSPEVLRDKITIDEK